MTEPHLVPVSQWIMVSCNHCSGNRVYRQINNGKVYRHRCLGIKLSLLREKEWKLGGKWHLFKVNRSTSIPFFMGHLLIHLSRT